MSDYVEKLSQEELIAATTYEIFRTGSERLRHYQINKLIMGVPTGEKYWVHLKGSREFFCDCSGFARQKFPALDHKHIKIALDFHERGEPHGALYKIHGTGAKTTIEALK